MSYRNRKITGTIYYDNSWALGFKDTKSAQRAKDKILQSTGTFLPRYNNTLIVGYDVEEAHRLANLANAEDLVRFRKKCGKRVLEVYPLDLWK